VRIEAILFDIGGLLAFADNGQAIRELERVLDGGRG
jgi:hypothetical protein